MDANQLALFAKSMQVLSRGGNANPVPLNRALIILLNPPKQTKGQPNEDDGCFWLLREGLHLIFVKRMLQSFPHSCKNLSFEQASQILEREVAAEASENDN
ncbi:hypothetical protein HYC85_007182 [Camellia sinensis]|uniref:Uncharacterized protein n=1 Tax=Camellia sinensis TaxID=4442 RepID=A0A7J7HQL7_CAMSI|nr:hypothetical protein HYC85_007182 [Camellia sinensis]